MLDARHQEQLAHVGSGGSAAQALGLHPHDYENQWVWGLGGSLGIQAGDWDFNGYLRGAQVRPEQADGRN